MTETIENTGTWQPETFPLPDFSALAGEAERRAPTAAQRSGVDAAEVMGAGYEPPGLGGICDERTDALNRLATHAVRQGNRAEVLLRTHEKAEAQRATRLARLESAQVKAQTEVDRLTQRGSRRPGDGRASEVAISGGMGKRLRRDGPPLILLILLLGVEIPLYYETFLNLGDNPRLTVVFAIVAVLVFGFGPHLYGRKFREWQEEGVAPRGAREFRLRDWISRPSPMILLPALWIVAIFAVAYTRLKALTAPQTYTTSTGEEKVLKSISDGIGAVPTFVLLLALMIFTAIIAVESGRRMGNPNDRRLRDERSRLRDLTAELDQPKNQAVADVHYRAELEQFLNGGDPHHRALVQQLEGGYDRVESSYVAAFLTVPGADDPEVSGYASTIIDNHRRRRH